jgi:hypothetical protein
MGYVQQAPSRETVYDIFFVRPLFADIYYQRGICSSRDVDNDTLILGDENFAAQEDAELQKAGFSVKPVDILLYKTSLAFNGCILQMQADNIELVQKGQSQRISLIDPEGQTRI